MTREIVMILIFAAAILTYGLIRRIRERKREETAQVIICEVTCRDREGTKDFLDAYFGENLISVLSEKCFVEGGEDDDLYTHEYKLFLPMNLTAAQMVGQLSTCEAVQSVHTKTE